MKSDQNGIESVQGVLLEQVVCSCWNQTKMGLKVCKSSDEGVGMSWVEIRPKWDWKAILSGGLMLIPPTLKSDQNGIKG